MASAFAHGVLAFSLARSVYPQCDRRFWGAAVACSILPDIDVVGFAYGVPYGAMLGHRGLTHSLMFALVAGLAAAHLVVSSSVRFSREWWGTVAFFFVITASHGVLDAMTDGGLGVAFFSPFDLTRYFLPWRPLAVSPIGIFDFFTEHSLRILETECVWVILPSLAFLGGMHLIRRQRRLTA